jgi:hypothetical protein
MDGSVDRQVRYNDDTRTQLELINQTLGRIAGKNNAINKTRRQIGFYIT